MTERYSDAISSGRRHPNRPLPSLEVSLGSDTEIARYYPEVLLAAAEGVEDVTTLMGRELKVNTHLFGQESELTEILEGFRETNPLNDLSQINVEKFVYHLARAGALDRERPLYFLTTKDLFEPRLNFMFGITVTGLGASVQSTYRFEEASRNPEWLAATARHMARHEFGHLVGLDESTIVNKDMRPGIYRSHCTNLCTMRQVMSVAETGRLIEQLNGRPNTGFCDDCVGSLARLG